MKIVVFAHTPPPMHGQSYMVKLMLDGLRANHAAPQIYHVDAKLSGSAEAIGKFKWTKLFLLAKYCLKAWWYRLARGAQCFYYIPAPGKRSALYRDWIVLALCRPLFKRIVFHWHAVGLGEWIENEANGWEKWITHRLLDDVALSIVLSEFGRADVEKFLPRKIAVVPNGIPDPCPDFDGGVSSQGHRGVQRPILGEQTRFVVLFVGACTEAKGLFVTLDAVALANQELKERCIPISISLIVAGEFVSTSERERFDKRIQREDLNGNEQRGKLVNYVGFVAGPDKDALFRRCDCLCFPSLYPAEGQPVTIIEALAFGLPVIATRWRGIPDLLAGADAYLIEHQDPDAIAHAVEESMKSNIATINRRIFLTRYSIDKFIAGLTQALLSID